MKNPKFCIAVLIFSFLILHLHCFAADQLTVTTYYPSPYGVYKTLRVFPTTDATCAVGLACNKGEFCYSSTTDQLFACGSSAQWATMGGGGGGWTDDGTVVRLTTDTDNVGIGTASPAESLDIGTGNIKMGYETPTQTVNLGGIATATCTGTKYVTGGGCACSNPAGTNSIRFSIPVAGNSWFCICNDGTKAVTAYAICAQIR